MLPVVAPPVIAGGIPLVAKILAGLGLTVGAGITANELKKAGENRAIIEMYKSGKLGSPTGGFGYGTGFGPGMGLPLSGYQSILQYQNQMGNQQRENMIKNLLAIEPITDRAKTRDFERQMGAARFRTQLGTQQGLTLQGQVGAQRLAQQGMQGATQALASNYQYQ